MTINKYFNIFYYLAGILFLTLAKIKIVLKGYQTPKPFDISELDRCIEYDIGVVEHWLTHFRNYTHGDNTIAGKNILELGPGSDLGIGIYLLSKGCLQYNACDVNDLVKNVPDGFYAKFLERLKKINSLADTAFLEEQLKLAQAGKSSRLNYVVRKDFDIVSAFGRGAMDIVFSQAAFEHFDDINATVSQLSEVCRPGAILVVEIDLKTHSRWIRDKDPNNIYRYPDWLYNIFWFRGMPNRVRPYQYREAFERSGWTDVVITPRTTLGDRNGAYSGMHNKFADSRNQMDYLTVMLYARKS